MKTDAAIFRSSVPPNPYMEVMVGIELITPTKARVYLEKNAGNRKIRNQCVIPLKRDFVAGKAVLTNDAICFDEAGNLINGQHRLTACVESSVSFWSIVAVGMPAGCVIGMDRGLGRSMADMLVFSGIEDASSGMGSLINTMHHPINWKADEKLTATEAVEFVQLHHEAIRYSINAFSGARGSGVRRAHVRAAVARAWYHADRDRLTRFCECLIKNQLLEPGDEAANVLMKWLLSIGRASIPSEIHRKVERAIVAFLGHERITKLYSADKELFPLPDE